MKISIPGLGGRLQRARKGTGLSQEKVATQLGISWMTVHRWERSQRMISEEHLNRLWELYDRPLRWFLTLEDGDLDEETGNARGASRTPLSAAAERLSRKIADAPESHRRMVENVVECLLDGMRDSV